MSPTTFQPWLARWQLQSDGDPLHTYSSDLWPVRWQGQAAMLKLARSEEERRGAAQMTYWRGEGAARVLEVSEDGAALLLERLSGPRSLTALVQTGQDDEASRILCAAVAELHRPRPQPRPALVPLRVWFRALWEGARTDPRLRPAAALARDLLDDPRDVVVLHGDIHHANVLDAGARGWLAIDPKGLWGERGYDYANILCNPDLSLALSPGRLERQLDVVARAARLDPERLRRWVAAYTGLSAAWWLEDGAAEAAAPVLELHRRVLALL
ncbi:MAG: aminoglycoside phosphotransferase family protein [Deinococcus sp.]|uniref:aminoglycoside phosphotransferase family protein n=1 Tax=Deinococcus sp. TaxID=47478 RepID=UPI0026DB2016|nr:aminoglycoside phosphotransferase family protein [Deinococcus sp.]MDO4245046.1 aminoglycoside phosphotransferase family protein [Deinococcus sp.]